MTVPGELAAYFDRISAVTRLREVRVLNGFSRLQPSDGIGTTAGEGMTLAPLAVTHQTWLPAVEMRGEGIFLEFAIDRMAEWQSEPPVMKRSADLVERLQIESLIRQISQGSHRSCC